ncbi:MAG: hypothetical protein ACKOA9_04065 [Actinomycetota bacterium]
MSRLLRRCSVGLLGVFVLGGVLATGAAAQPGGTGGPPAWGPGQEGPDVVHQMRGNAPSGGTGTPSPLTYRGGAVVSAAGGPQILLVFWGSQWVNNDPAGVAPYLESFLRSLHGAGDTWSTSTTQYCSGVAPGSSTCAGQAGATYVTHNASDPVVGVFNDTAVAAPKKPSQGQIAAEAVKAAKQYNVDPTRTQVVVATAHNNNAAGFGSSYCAWHSSTSYNGTYLAYTNLPYIPDAGSSCGANYVSGGSVTVLQGVSIVEGHEYAETVTDPFPNSGWLDANGAENGDKCSWIRSGQGASAYVSLNGRSFPVQSLWSNATSSCVISY